MNDVLQNIRSYLLTQTAITALVANRVYPNWYPENPVLPFAVVRINSGSLSGEAPRRSVDLQVRSYDLTDRKSQVLDNLILEALTGASASDQGAYLVGIGNYGFQHFTCSALGSAAIDPDTSWAYTLAGYETEIIN